MAFQVEERAYEMIAALEPLMARTRQRDESLADQLARAKQRCARYCGGELFGSG
jgi:hypothetical protein